MNQKSDFCWFTSYIKSSTQDVNQETPKDYMCYEELKDGLRYTCSTYTLLRQLLGSDYMKVELMSRIHFNPGTPVIGEKPEFICVKDSEVIQLKVRELIQQFETEGFKREEIAVIETGQWKDVIKQILRLDMNGDGEGALSEAKSLISCLAISDEETKDAHSVNFFLMVEIFHLEEKNTK
ncbi:hypothetical protein QYM36_019139 [Artemia franciscana]|uniref:Uncharacterized protein n=1 Tax=Artemia franciscana TaxID=6661 RepID=A0AA88HBD1_ARTSF|nr:hypothetical protein QYM36_019139 [Artemia franciscana]